MPTRNQEAYFSELPKLDIQRSVFNMPFSHKTSFNVGQVIPFYVGEVLPGDSHNVTTSIVARLQTLMTPMMDNMYLDTYWFFVPNRLVWDHWKNFCGENAEGPWTTDQVKYTVPYLKYPEETCFSTGSIADYMGVPLGGALNTLISAAGASDKNYPMVLPFRGYAMIINEFFRDQNIQQPVVIHKDETIRTGVVANFDDPDAYITDLELGGAPFVAARYHDYFSSCLPAPQRSESISIFGNVVGTSGPFAPVVGLSDITGNKVPTRVSVATESSYDRFLNIGSTASTNQNYVTSGNYTGAGLIMRNLWADLGIADATITQLRLAFQLQKYYEKSARGGARYREYLAEFFGVTNGDARMQVPEYLGGHRIPLSIHQVANTSQSADSDLGDLGAMSNTSDVHEDFHMSFSEHGFLFGLCVVRYDNTYAQGLERFWSRRDILDFYNPVFAHISEQPVYVRELSLAESEVGDELVFQPDRVFGYNEAWADYRYKPSRVSGEMRPEVQNSLASWHLSDDYETAPFLSNEWLQTDKNTVDRVLAVGSSVSNQVFCDIFVQDKCARPMPVHSIPGFADHF